MDELLRMRFYVDKLSAKMVKLYLNSSLWVILILTYKKAFAIAFFDGSMFK